MNDSKCDVPSSDSCTRIFVRPYLLVIRCDCKEGRTDSKDDRCVASAVVPAQWLTSILPRSPVSLELFLSVDTVYPGPGWCGSCRLLSHRICGRTHLE